MQSDRSPKWVKWRNIPQLQLWQAVALSLDIDPDQIRKSHHYSIQFHEGKEFADRLQIAMANTGFGSKRLVPIRCEVTTASTEINFRDFVEFARTVEWTLPELFPAGDDRVDRQAINKELWLTEDAWSEAEFSELLCGWTPNASRQSDEAFKRALEEIRRAAVVMKTLKPHNMSDATASDRFYAHDRFYAPADAIAWAATKGVLFPEFPFCLSDVVKPVELGTRERETLLKMLLASVYSSYGYRGTEKKSDVPRKLEKHLCRLGIPLSVETIRDKLQQAWELLPSGFDK